MVTVNAEDDDTTIFGHTVSDLQDDLEVTGTSITGKLKYVSTGALADGFGPGHFMALKFENLETAATSIKIGLDPSEGTGLVELLGDPDMNGTAKVTDKDVQKFMVVTTTPQGTTTTVYDLSGLEFVYDQSELEAMTIAQIKAIAAERDYTITQTTKAAIITEFLAQQNA